jgi:hypothetical protein
MSIRYRIAVAASFVTFPFVVAIPSYLLGESFTLSPTGGAHIYFPLQEMMLAGLVHAPLLAVAAALSARAFLSSREYLFRYAPPGHFIVGAMIVVLSTYLTTFVFFGLAHRFNTTFFSDAYSLSLAFAPLMLTLWVGLGGLWGIGTALLLRAIATKEDAVHSQN